MRYSAKKKKKGKSLSALKKELDRVFSIYIRQRDANEYGYITCVSCKKAVHWQEANNCHYADRQHMATRWDERNCNSGCVQCNAWNKGFHIHEYGKWLNNTYGDGEADRLIALSRTVAKFNSVDLETMIEYYKSKINH
jgi:hypothetical protein